MTESVNEAAAPVRRGDTVLMRGITNNGSDEHAAVVTAVWSQEMVNLKIFVDFGPVIDRGSVPYFDSREKADAYQAAQNAVPVFVCFPRD